MAQDNYTQGVSERAQHECARSVGGCTGSEVIVHGMSECAQHT